MPANLPPGDDRFHPYQRVRAGMEAAGSRLVVCDGCGWVAHYGGKYLPWDGCFLHIDAIRKFFSERRESFSVNKLGQYYEKRLS